MPIIPATWETEIKRIAIPDQLGEGCHFQDPISMEKAEHGGAPVIPAIEGRKKIGSQSRPA
jgi:hypothetical protein